MVIDSSAIVTILSDEPERARFVEAIDADEMRLISAATFVEVSIVIEARYGPAGTRLLDRFLERAAVEIVPVDDEQAREARRAFTRFGKGRHPAGLSFGDCFSYALASALAEPLLYKGDGFPQTDVIAACPK
ncbi:MAG TPA: type II toxin-antitoxin system VapC family toxin [Vicinamibacterales bacterium]